MKLNKMDMDEWIMIEILKVINKGEIKETEETERRNERRGREKKIERKERGKV